MSRFPLVIRLTFCAALSLVNTSIALAAKTMSLELFQIRQFELQFNQLAEIYAADGDHLLDPAQLEAEGKKEVRDAFGYLGISELKLDYFMKGIADYAQGTFHTQAFKCASTPYPVFNPDTSQSAAINRLALLSKHGPRLLWSAMEFGAYGQAIIAEEFTKEHLPAICGRVTQLQKELACLAENPGQCPNDITALLKQAPLEFDSDAGKKLMFAVSAQVEPIKNALHSYIDQITWLLSVADHPLAGAVLDTIGTTPRNYDVLEQILRETLIAQFRRQASVALFDAYLALPEAARNLIESDDLSVVLKEANTAMQTVHAYRSQVETFKNETGDELKGLAKKRYDQTLLEAEKVIEASVDDVGQSLRLFLSDYAPIDTPENPEDILNLPAKEICDSLEKYVVTDDWGPNMWGVAPTEKDPIGFRFVFSQVEQRHEDAGLGIKLYEGEFQLLVYVPPGSFKSATMSNKKGEKFSCVREGTPTYAVLRTGYLFENAYKDLNAESSANGFLQYTRLPRNKTDSSLLPLATALKKLGVISEWLEGDPSWDVSDDYQNVSVTVRMLGKEIPIEVIKYGVVVLNAAEMGRRMCRDIESTIMPNLVGSWASDYPVLLGDDWSLSIKGGGDAKIDIAACDLFYAKADNGLPHPLQKSDLAVNAQVVLNGVIHGDAFQWPASANLVVKKRKVALKSLVFGDTPAAVKNAVEKLFGRTQQRWTAGESNKLKFTLVTGTLKVASDLQSVHLPVFVQVASPTCAAQQITGYLELPDGNLVADSGSLETAVKEAAVCNVQRTVNEYIAKNILQCDKIDGNVFGLTKVEVTVDKAKSTDALCQFDIAGQFFNQSVNIKKVKAHTLANGGGFKLDFSGAKIDSSLETAIRNEISAAVGDMANHGVIIDKLHFSAQSLMFEVSFTLPAPIGTIEVGTVTLSAETGRLTMDSELERVLAKRVIAYLTPKLNAIIESVAPDFIQDPKIHEPTYKRGQFALAAVFSIKVHEDLPLIPAKLKLLPELSAEIDIEKAAIDAAVKGVLNEFVFERLPMKAPPVEAQFKDYYLTPSYELTLILGVKIGLDELGEIGVDRIYINEKGVTFRGRAELRVGIPIYLVPAPIPVVLTRPGIFYDFDEEEVGALGALTVIAPDIDKLLNIDVALGVGDPNRFITELTLKGDLVLLNSIPVIMTKGTLDFERLQITFSGEISEIFKAIMDAKIEGDIKPKPGTASLKTKLAILGADLLEAEFTADIRECPRRCIKGGAEVDLLIGNGHVKAEFGPLLVDALLDMGIVLDIFGKKYSTVDLEVESLRAHLEGKILKVLKLSIRTPGLKEMSPSYIAEVIASLLEVDLKDILSWLKNPKIEIAPAGSGDSGGDGDSNNSGGADGSSQQNQNGQAGGMGAPPPSSDAAESESAQPPIDQASEIPSKYRIAQRFPAHNGQSIAGCRERGKSWGYIVYYAKWNHWGYHGRVWGMPQDVFDTVCKRSGTGRGPWDHLKVFAIEDNWHPLYTLSSPSWRYPEASCTIKGGSKECMRDYPSYRVRHWEPEKGKKKPLHPRSLNYVGRHYASETASKTTEDSVSIKLDREVGEDLVKSKVSDPYLQKILRSMLNTEEEVKADVITSFSETEAGDGEGVGGKISSFFSGIGNRARKTFNSSTLNYTVTYKTVEVGKALYCRELAVIFNDKKGNTLFSHHCPTWKNNQSMGYFSRQNGSSMNDKAKQLLSKGQIVVNPAEMTVLTKEQTHWYLNIGMPSLLSSREVPDIGNSIDPDPVVGQCAANTSIDSIYVFDYGDNLSLNITKRFESAKGGSSTESSQLLIAKRGGHKAWTESKNPALLKTMASYLSCQTNSEQWLESHRLWLKPQGNTLLFYPVNKKEGDHRPVLEIQPRTTPRTILMPMADPYSKTRLTTEVKQLLYDRIKGTMTDRVSIIINVEHRWEILVKEAPGDVINVDLITMTCTQPVTESDPYKCALIMPLNDKTNLVAKESKKSYKLDVQELVACFANFGPTQIRPSKYDASGIFHYLNLENPGAKTGVAPHWLFRELHHHDTRSCKPL